MYNLVCLKLDWFMLRKTLIGGKLECLVGLRDLSSFVEGEQAIGTNSCEFRLIFVIRLFIGRSAGCEGLIIIF